METINITKNTDKYYLSRWLFLKKKITQKEMFEYNNTKTRDEMITLIHDMGFKIKVREKDEVSYDPASSELYD